MHYSTKAPRKARATTPRLLIRADTHSGVPVYRQIIDQIRFHVASGLLTPGDALPSTRDLSAQLALNPMTVSKAYSLLERQGLVERRPGLSTVVRARRSREARLDRTERLRATLAPAATAARQLGIGVAEALGVFRDVLEEIEPDDGSD